MRTIREQLTRKLLLGFAVLLGLGGIGVYLSTRAALLDQFDQTLCAKANGISSATEQRGKRIEVEFSEQFMRGFEEGEAMDFFQLRRADGTTVKRSKSLTTLDLPSSFGTFRRPKFWNLTLPSGVPGRASGYTFTLPRARKNESPEPIELTLVVASDRRKLDETLATFAFVLLGCGSLLLVATVLIVPRVLRHELVPLNQLADQATQINADSLSTRFPTDAVPGELKPISERLNHLLARLESSFERERRFSGDLAHELRTPIAELRSLAELALKWPESRPAETDRDALAIAIQMENIVTRLLELLRSERGQLLVMREQIALASLVEKVLRPFNEKAAGKQLQVGGTVAADAAVESDPVLLRSIVTNLVENAVEYTPPGGIVQIESRMDEGRFILQVTNTVEQFTSDDLPKLFDRFWRKDSARSSNHHSGLGLSLARAFAQALGFDLTATLESDSRLTLRLSRPALSA